MTLEIATLAKLFPPIKGVIIAITTLGVIHSGLQPFLQALTIAIVSAIIGAAGLIGAAIIARQKVAELKDQAAVNEAHLQDLKRKLDINQRVTDKPSGGVL